MRRVFTRLLIWLRWPSGVPAVFVLTLALMSYIWHPFAVASLWDLHSQLDLDCGCLRAFVFLQPDPFTWPVDIHCDIGDRHYEIEWFKGWWSFQHVGGSSATHRVDIFVFPAWCVFLPLGAFSWAGFRAKRRMAMPAGLCTRCRYPLAGAAVCPECGTAAASARK